METIIELFKNPGFAAITGAVFGGIIATFSSILLIRVGQKVEAGKILRQALSKSIGLSDFYCDNIPEYEWDGLLKDQATAVNNFKRFLREENATSLDTAWREYACPDKQKGSIACQKFYFRKGEELEKRVDAIAAFTRKSGFLSWLENWL